MRVLRAHGLKAHGLTVPARKGCPSGHDLAIAADLPVRDRALVIVVTARAKAHALVTVIEIVVKDRVLVIAATVAAGASVVVGVAHEGARYAPSASIM